MLQPRQSRLPSSCPCSQTRHVDSRPSCRYRLRCRSLLPWDRSRKWCPGSRHPRHRSTSRHSLDCGRSWRCCSQRGSTCQLRCPRRCYRCRSRHWWRSPKNNIHPALGDWPCCLGRCSSSTSWMGPPCTASRRCRARRSHLLASTYRVGASTCQSGASTYRPAYPPYRAGDPSYQREAPSYQREAPSYQREAPSYQREAPSYRAGDLSYQREAPSYQREDPPYPPAALPCLPVAWSCPLGPSSYLPGVPRDLLMTSCHLDSLSYRHTAPGDDSRLRKGLQRREKRSILC